MFEDFFNLILYLKQAVSLRLQYFYQENPVYRYKYIQHIQLIYSDFLMEMAWHQCKR